MYLLDTDIVSNLIRRVPSTTLIARLASVPASRQFTSSITYGELLYGAYRRGPRAAAPLHTLESALFPSLPILPFDAAAAAVYGEIRAQLEESGTPIGDADTRIAGIALARGLAVVTGNVRHFERVAGLTVENWLGR